MATSRTRSGFWASIDGERLGSVPAKYHIVTTAAQEVPEEVPDFRLVVDN